MKTILEIEEYAKKHFVPIARKEFVEYLKKVIIENNYHEVLEIGSAIGYITINLAMMENVYVTTIEYNDTRYEVCVENIEDFNLQDKVNAIHDDALEVFISQKFDVIFIDAAKAKNIKFFEKYNVNLKQGGIIIIDNIDMKDFKANVSPKKARFYENKIDELKEYLHSLSDFECQYLPVGDGIYTLKHK